MPTIKTVVEVTDMNIAYVLCAGMEGGINYWAAVKRYITPKELKFRFDKDHVYKHIDYPMNKGGAVVLISEEENDGKELRLTYSKLVKGMRLMANKYPHHFANAKDGGGDAETGDVLIQLAVFGEVVYG